MSVLRIYAETGACLLNTGPEIDHATDAIRRSMKEEVLLYYDPAEAFLRCYVQVHRAQPEQFAFEYEHDGDGDVFEEFVRDARAEVEKTNWRIIDENSAVFTALEAGPYAEPGTAESDVQALLVEDEPIEFAATDRTTAVGLAAYLRETFGDDRSIAISRAGRVRPVTDADFVIVPDQSYTGLTGATKDRLERVKVGFWREELRSALDDVAAGTSGRVRERRLAERVTREGIDDRFEIVARPTSDSWVDPALRWFVATGGGGLLLVTAYLLAITVPGQLLTLLQREVELIFPPPAVPLPDALATVLPEVTVGYTSWMAVVVAGAVLGGGMVALVTAGERPPIPSIEVTLPSFSGGQEVASEYDDASATPDRSLDECLDHLVEAAGRQTAVESLTSALAERDVDVLTKTEASLYALGVRAAGAGLGLAVSATFYLVAAPLLARAMTLLSNWWSVVLNGVIVVALGIGIAGVGVRIRSAVRSRRGSDRPTGTGSGDVLGSQPSGHSRRSEVSRDRIRRLLNRTDDPDYLNREVDRRRLLKELKKNPHRNDIAKLLRQYEEVADIAVVPADKRYLIESGSTETSAATDTPGTVVSDVTGDANAREGASSGDAADTDTGGKEPDDDTTTDESDHDTDSPSDEWFDAPMEPVSPGVDADDGTDHGEAPGDTSESVSTPAASTVPDTPVSFPAFRYDGANSGYVRGSVNSVETLPSKRWEYHVDDEPLSPVVTEEAVYVVDTDGGVYAVDDEGTELWRTTVDDGVKSQPTVHDGTLYFGSDSGRAYAIDTTGERRWDRQVGGSAGRSSTGRAAVITPPTVAGGSVYVGDTNGGVHARDRATGAREWRDDIGGATYGKPAFQDGTLYVATENGSLATFGEDGTPGWKANAGQQITSTPVVADGAGYLVDGRGVVHRLETVEEGTETGTYPLGSSNPVSPTVGDGRVFLGTRTGTVTAVDADLRDRHWQVETDHGDRIFAPFVLDERALYVPAGRYLYAFDPTTGEKFWSYRLKSEVKTQPALARGTLYVTTTSGTVRALALDDA
jgi:outer membrane protein assembly factor BamB